MGHINDQMGKLGLTKCRTRRPSQPYEKFSRAELWQALEELRSDMKRAQAKVNLLGRDLRRTKQMEFSDRAYSIRDILSRHPYTSTADKKEALRDLGFERD